MAYTPRTQGETDYIQDFISNQAAIEDYKRSRGGSYEDAYQAVTGRPWVEGRSVKVKGGQPEMTKDRTVGSILGKYVLPSAAIAATAFGIPGLFPGLISGGGAGAAGTAGGLLPNAALPGTASAMLSGAPSAAGGVSSRFLGDARSRVGGRAGDIISRVVGGAGAGIAGATAAAADNRAAELKAAIEQEKLRQRQQEQYEQQLIARAQEDRTSLTDAFLKSAQAQQLISATPYRPSMVSQMPGAIPSAIPSFGTGPAMPSQEMRGNAQSIYDMMVKRVTGGSQLPPLLPPSPYTNDPSLLRPRPGERIGGWLGPVLGIIGGINQLPPGGNPPRRTT